MKFYKAENGLNPPISMQKNWQNEGFNPQNSMQPNIEKRGFNPPKTSRPAPKPQQTKNIQK